MNRQAMNGTKRRPAAAQTRPDVYLQDQGTLTLIEPLTESAWQWIQDDLTLSGVSGLVAILHQDGRRLAAEMTSDGLRVTAAQPVRRRSRRPARGAEPGR